MTNQRKECFTDTGSVFRKYCYVRGTVSAEVRFPRFRNAAKGTRFEGKEDLYYKGVGKEKYNSGKSGELKPRAVMSARESRGTQTPKDSC